MNSKYIGRSLPNKVEGILFDFDGTLVQLEPKWWAPLEKAFIKVNGSVPEEELIKNIPKMFANFPKDQSKLFLLKVMYTIARKAGLSRWKSVRFIKEARIAYSKSRHINIPFDGIENMISDLQSKGMKLGIVSSASGSELDIAIEELTFLKGIPVVSRYDVKELKPSAEPIIKGLKLINVNAANVVYVGDFATDIIAGKAAGTMTCGILGPYPEISITGLENAEPDTIIHKTIDLLGLL